MDKDQLLTFYVQKTKNIKQSLELTQIACNLFITFI